MHLAKKTVSDNGDALLQSAGEAMNLPWPTLRAAERAVQYPGLMQRARLVLRALARTVDHRHPADKIYARRALLQERATISERTFFRALTDLEEAGLIIRYEHWSMHGRAGFNRAYISFTLKAIQSLFGGVDTVTRSQTIARRITARSVQTTEGGSGYPRTAVANVQTEDEPLSESYSHSAPSTATMAEAIKEDLYQSKQERQPGSLPEDLLRLLGLGFRKFFVFKLMREAKACGKRLSDVVSVAWDYLSKARSPISYLNALLRSTTDFGTLARQREIRDTQNKETQRDRVQRVELTRALAGRWFVDVQHKRRFEVSSDGAVVSIHEPGQLVRSAGGDWQEAFVHALRQGHLIAERDWLSPVATFSAIQPDVLTS